jgi:hypothetical protein
MTGFGFNIQPICQMLAGYMFPGRPLANFYFTCYTFNATSQAQLLAKDLRLAQYSHLSPYATFWLQCAGCIIGAIFNWVMMVRNIILCFFEVLMSIPLFFRLALFRTRHQFWPASKAQISGPAKTSSSSTLWL